MVDSYYVYYILLRDVTNCEAILQPFATNDEMDVIDLVRHYIFFIDDTYITLTFREFNLKV